MTEITNEVFEKCSSFINQGDIFVPLKDEYADIFAFKPDNISKCVGMIVLTNSCDIQNGKIQYISIAPIISLKDYVGDITQKKKDEKKSDQDIKKSIKGFISDLMTYNSKRRVFYLPENSAFNIGTDFLVIIESAISYPLVEVENIIINRRICSLKSPWKEKLGWSVGNLYNRVSLNNFSPVHESKLQTKFLH